MSEKLTVNHLANQAQSALFLRGILYERKRDDNPCVELEIMLCHRIGNTSNNAHYELHLVRYHSLWKFNGNHLGAGTPEIIRVCNPGTIHDITSAVDQFLKDTWGRAPLDLPQPVVFARHDQDDDTCYLIEKISFEMLMHCSAFQAQLAQESCRSNLAGFLSHSMSQAYYRLGGLMRERITEIRSAVSQLTETGM